MPPRKETVWFIVLALLLSWAVGAWWLRDEHRFVLIRLMMCIPGLVGIGCACLGCWWPLPIAKPGPIG